MKTATLYSTPHGPLEPREYINYLGSIVRECQRSGFEELAIVIRFDIVSVADRCLASRE